MTSLEDLKHIFLLIVTLTTPVGAMLNSFLLLANCRNLSELPPSSLLAFWFSFYDNVNLLSSFTVSVPSLFGTFDNNANSTSAACQAHGIIELISGLGSISICFGLTFIRYSVIVWKVYPRRTFVAIFVVVSATTAAVVSVTPSVIGNASTQYVLRASGVYCMAAWYYSPAFTGVCLSILALPLCSIAYAYAHIYYCVTSVRVKIVVSITPGQEAVSKEGTITVRAANEVEEVGEKQNALLLQTVTIVSTFLVGWMPYAALVLQEVITREPASALFDFIAIYFVLLMATFNPIVIMVFDKPIRKNAGRALAPLSKLVELRRK
ncbi:hypothetical protein HDU83_007234 [Entophlyctis luteolus]|nr:hypothetical protein HDU83_007234 [Entophlyctis luteolus]